MVVVADDDRRGEALPRTAAAAASRPGSSMPGLEEADELLGIHGPRQRPQARARAAGKDDRIDGFMAVPASGSDACTQHAIAQGSASAATARQARSSAAEHDRRWQPLGKQVLQSRDLLSSCCSRSRDGRSARRARLRRRRRATAAAAAHRAGSQARRVARCSRARADRACARRAARGGRGARRRRVCRFMASANMAMFCAGIGGRRARRSCASDRRCPPGSPRRRPTSATSR